LGMQTEQVITIKKLDGEYWDEMEGWGLLEANRRVNLNA
jgi:hypothetical protein